MLGIFPADKQIISLLHLNLILLMDLEKQSFLHLSDNSSTVCDELEKNPNFSPINPFHPDWETVFISF